MAQIKTDTIKWFAAIFFVCISIVEPMANPSFSKEVVEDKSTELKKFNFSSAPNANTDNVDKALVARHFLGEDIAVLSYVVRKTYVTRRTDASGTSCTETSKPAIYNAVLDMNKQFKKAVKKGIYTSEEAGKIYSDCLKKSYSLYYVETQELEKLMAEMKNLEQYIALFNCISFE